MLLNEFHLEIWRCPVPCWVDPACEVSSLVGVSWLSLTLSLSVTLMSLVLHRLGIGWCSGLSSCTCCMWYCWMSSHLVLVSLEQKQPCPTECCCHCCCSHYFHSCSCCWELGLSVCWACWWHCLYLWGIGCWFPMHNHCLILCGVAWPCPGWMQGGNCGPWDIDRMIPMISWLHLCWLISICCLHHRVGGILVWFQLLAPCLASQISLPWVPCRFHSAWQLAPLAHSLLAWWWSDLWWPWKQFWCSVWWISSCELSPWWPWEFPPCCLQWCPSLLWPPICSSLLGCIAQWCIHKLWSFVELACLLVLQVLFNF